MKDSSSWPESLLFRLSEVLSRKLYSIGWMPNLQMAFVSYMLPVSRNFINIIIGVIIIVCFYLTKV